MSEVEQLRNANKDLREEIELLRQEIVELKERLSLSSSNSSKPPSAA